MHNVLMTRQIDPAKGDGQSLCTMAILSTLMAFASISTDMYLPAMPQMAGALGASPGQLEWTISGYLVGFCLGQLAWGPLSDRFGRRLPIAAGLILFLIGSAGCAMALSSATLIGWRVLQALGASASVVIARAIVRDLYRGARAAKLMSTLMTVMAIAPLLGPRTTSNASMTPFKCKPLQVFLSNFPVYLGL